MTDAELKRDLARKTRRSFLVGGAAAAAGLAGYKWITSAGDENALPRPQRRVLDFNGKLAHAYLSDSGLMPAYSADQVGYLKPNGDIGLNASEEWTLRLEPGDGVPGIDVALADIQALPRVQMITRFCCIEGWSVIAHWTGARFSDFTRKYLPPNSSRPPYVYMATPGEDYYVGLDMKSALHPQTLLAYEQNGKPLEAVHGAPLRLVVPVKYGIKSIKKIGLIRYTGTKPGDYWAEEGYDWFAGL
ncbi:MAG: molybdopterin-dependent oxidoreductase [Bryobacteraceae bacterium]